MKKYLGHAHMIKHVVLENTLSEKNQMQKGTCHMILFVQNVHKDGSGFLVAKDREVGTGFLLHDGHGQAPAEVMIM